MWEEFKHFISNKNIVTMATGIIMGNAFTKIVNSLVNDIFMPIIVAITGKTDVTGLALQIGNTHIGYGVFLQAIINFLMIAAFLYLTLKALEKVQGSHIVSKDPDEDKPKKPTETELLTDILNELKKK